MSKTQQPVASFTLKEQAFRQINLKPKKLESVKQPLGAHTMKNVKIVPQDIIRHQRNLIVFLIIGLSLYIFALDFLIQLGTRSGVLLNAISWIVLGLIGYQLVLKSAYPKSVHGLHLENWKSSVREAIIWSLGFIGIAVVLKALLITFIPSFQEWSLLTLNVFYNFGWSNMCLIMLVYSLFVPMQELLGRCLIQATLQQTLEGKYAKISAILITTIIFCACHVITNPMLAYVTIVPSIFWGILYARNPSLLGVSVSHFILGNFFLFFEYLPIPNLVGF